MSGAKYPDSFFFAIQNRWISCVHYPGKLYFISITIIKAFFTNSEVTWFHVHTLFQLTAFSIVGVEPGVLILSSVVTASMGLQGSEKIMSQRD